MAGSKSTRNSVILVLAALMFLGVFAGVLSALA